MSATAHDACLCQTARFDIVLEHIAMPPMNRRRFLQAAGAVAALGESASASYPAVSLVVDPSDPIANSAPAKWAAQELERSLRAAGSTVQRTRALTEAARGNQCVVVAGSRSAVALD